VPIIICTVLPQEALALALGADAFLQKPVSQADFLAALDRLALA
jgi:CheY-like chemotaxis protein